MQNEKLFLYFDTETKNEADVIVDNLKEYNLSLELVNIETDSYDKELIEGLKEKFESPYPMLRIGDEKIRAVLVQPSTTVLNKIFNNSSGESLNLPEPQIFSTTFCGDCRQLKQWMDLNNIKFSESIIEGSEELIEQIVRWSGGRRVVPTVLYPGIGRFFNPGLNVFKNLHPETT